MSHGSFSARQDEDREAQTNVKTIDDKLLSDFIFLQNDADVDGNVVKEKVLGMIQMLCQKYLKIERELSIEAKIKLYGLKFENGIVYINTSENVKDNAKVVSQKEYKGLFHFPVEVKNTYYGADAIALSNLSKDSKYVVFLQALSNIEVPGRRYLDSSIADVLRNIQRMIYHEEKMLLHYCSSMAFSKHLSQAYNDFDRAKRKYLSSITYGDSEEDEDDDDESLDSFEYQYDVVPYDAVDEVEGSFPFLLRKPVKVSPFIVGMNILLDAASRYQLRKEGAELRQRKMIYTFFLEKNDNDELVCEHCRCTESQHPIHQVAARKDHAFVPEVLIKGTEKNVNSFAWVKFEKDSLLHQKAPLSDIQGFVNYIINTSHPMYSVLVRLKDPFVKELINCTNESRLPSVQRQKSEDQYGPINAFKNGIFICMECKFFTYDEFETLQEQGLYKDMISHYSDEWFFIERYEKQIKGRPLCHSSLNRPAKFRFENFVPNLHCLNCGMHQFNHKKICKQPDFSVLKCKLCQGFCQYDNNSVSGVVPFENDNFKACVCSKNKIEPNCYILDVPKGIEAVDTPFIDSVFDEQFLEHDDYKQYLGIYFWVFVLGGYFILPLNKSNSWEIIPGNFVNYIFVN